MAAITISLDLTVQAENGPRIDFSNPQKVQAYDRLDIEVPAKTDGSPGTANVALQPSVASLVKFLLIKPKVLSIQSLQYTVSDGTQVAGTKQDGTTGMIDKETAPMDLSEPHLYSEGMMKFITNASATARAKIDPKVLKFSNNSDQSIAIEILVGRDATS